MSYCWGHDCFLFNLVFPESNQMIIHVQATPSLFHPSFLNCDQAFFWQPQRGNITGIITRKKCAISLTRILVSTHESESHIIVSCRILVRYTKIWNIREDWRSNMVRFNGIEVAEKNLTIKWIFDAEKLLKRLQRLHKCHGLANITPSFFMCSNKDFDS